MKYVIFDLCARIRICLIMRPSSEFLMLWKSMGFFCIQCVLIASSTFKFQATGPCRACLLVKISKILVKMVCCMPSGRYMGHDSIWTIYGRSHVFLAEFTTGSWVFGYIYDRFISFLAEFTTGSWVFWLNLRRVQDFFFSIGFNYGIMTFFARFATESWLFWRLKNQSTRYRILIYIGRWLGFRHCENFS